MSLDAPRNLAIGLKRQQKLVEPIGFESASCMEIKELCGATFFERLRVARLTDQAEELFIRILI
jgi:hypothetical protein